METTREPAYRPVRIAPTGCCRPFDPTPWDEQEVVWASKPFVKLHVRALLNIPLGMGPAITRAMARIAAAGATAPRGLMLYDATSAWGADLYIDVTGPVPGLETATLSGRFATKVFEGPYRDSGKWMRAMKGYLAARGLTAHKLYFAYTTCPSCAQAYGKNYVVALARLDEGDAGSGCAPAAG